MRAATKLPLVNHPFSFISIHAAHAGSDRNKLKAANLDEYISIHAAHEGCDLKVGLGFALEIPFQSTQPMRAATLKAALNFLRISLNFNPRSP